MSENTFRALVLDEGDGGAVASIKNVELDALPDGDVTVAVAYSDLNYKDGMILKGIGGLVKSYPHVPGIDFAGTVESSRSSRFAPGDPVILTGWRVGEVRWGGYASRARVPSDWLVPLPKGMTLLQSMALGTAGFTAMLAAIALEDHGLAPAADGEVLVSGAAGGGRQRGRGPAGGAGLPGGGRRPGAPRRTHICARSGRRPSSSAPSSRRRRRGRWHPSAGRARLTASAGRRSRTCSPSFAPTRAARPSGLPAGPASRLP